MQNILYVIMFFIVLGFIVKLSFRGTWAIVLTGLLLGVYVMIAGKYAPLQSKTQLADLLNNPGLMLDISVWISIESLLGIVFCLLAVQGMMGERPRYAKIVNYYPGLLILPILFYLLTQTIFAFPGTEFTVITRIMAGLVMAGIIGFTFFVKWAIPEKGIRLEILFISWIFILILGIIATVNGRPVIQGTHEPNFSALIALVLLAGGFVAAGFGWFYIRKSLFNK